MKAPRGIHDIRPDETPKWQALEALMREFAARYGYREIRTPVVEHTEVFQRTSGETSDIVEKEMYTFTDRGGRSLTLRPEGTAGVGRGPAELFPAVPRPAGRGLPATVGNESPANSGVQRARLPQDCGRCAAHHGIPRRRLPRALR